MNIQKILIPTKVRINDRKIKKSVYAADNATKQAQANTKNKVEKAALDALADVLTMVKNHITTKK